MTNKFTARVDRLTALGLTYNVAYGSFVKGDINVHQVEITTESDEDFDKIVTGIEGEIKRRAQGTEGVQGE